MTGSIPRHRLVEAIGRLDDLLRERLELITVHTKPTTRVECHPATGCGEPFGGAIADDDIQQQIAELDDSKIVGTLATTWDDQAGTATIILWATDRESDAFEQRVTHSLAQPRLAEVLRAAGRLKRDTWRRNQAMDQLRHAWWAATTDLGKAVTDTDLIGLGQVSRATFYKIPTPTDFVPTPLPEPAIQDPTPAPAPTSTPAPALPVDDRPAQVPAAAPTSQRPPKPSTPSKGKPARTLAVAPAQPARFTAPAVVLDAEAVHCADGTQHDWEAAHVGDLAMLVQQYRLGWGGGEDRLPDAGQIWLTGDALERLGLPADLGLPDDLLDRDEFRRLVDKRCQEIAQYPAFELAQLDGWQWTRVNAWTRIWHEDKLKAGAWIVALPWYVVGGVSLLNAAPGDDPAAAVGEGRTTPPVLVRRLHEFAQQVGISFRITSTSTGLDLIDHTRPPRRDASDDLGASRNRTSLIRGIPAELPPFLHDTDDPRFTNLEADFSWWRAWDTLTDAERSRKYAIAYDRGRSYLAPWSSISLGIDGLTHSDQPLWNGKEEPGYWLVDDWDDAGYPWWLPDIRKTSGAKIDDGRIWVTTHTLRQLAMVDINPTIHESWTWQNTARYLEPASRNLRAALDGAQDPDVTRAIKTLYSTTVGKLGERDHRPNYHLWRPDWRQHIIAATRTAIMHTLIKAHDRTGAMPLVVDRDTVIFAVDTDDPTTAWPGDPAKLGTGIGAWKPAAIADLTTWGPAHLPGDRLDWHYRYSDAMKAMTPTRK